jgi:chemotaxis protein methyltransferase CheR
MLREHLAELAGLVFDEPRRQSLEAVIAERMAATRRRTIPAYLELVTDADADGAAELQALLDAVTIQETHFFRNPPQIDALRRRVLPELLRRAVARDRPLTIWSAGCSTGEEPYTLAMLVLELAAATGHEPPETRILGTDISATALRVARRARYAGRTLAHVPPASLGRWFDVDDAERIAVVRPEVRELVELRTHNLVSEPVPFEPGELDLVVCRNVTIYFSRDTTRALVGRFHHALTDGGYLLLGHAETLWQMSDAFALVPVGDAFVYRRGPRGAQPRPDLSVVPAPRTPVRRVPVRPAAGPPSPADARPARAVREPGHGRLVGPRAAPTSAAGPATAEILGPAREALRAGSYADAARIAEGVAGEHPLLSDAYVLAGQAHATAGAHARAVAALRKAVYLDSRAGHAHFLLAGALARLGSYSAAATAYRAAAATLPTVDPEALGDLLDGRDVRELVQLCRRLADMTEQEAVS